MLGQTIRAVGHWSDCCHALFTNTEKDFDSFKEFVCDPKRCFGENADEELVWGLSEMMFDEDGQPCPEGREVVLQWIVEETFVPKPESLQLLTNGTARLSKDFKISPLTSDCLNQTDVKAIEVYFTSRNYTTHLETQFVEQNKLESLIGDLKNADILQIVTKVIEIIQKN